MTLDTTKNPFYLILARYYKWMFNGKLSQDFCTLFWNMLFSVLLLPFILVAAFPLWSDSCWKETTLAGKFFRSIGLYLAGIFMSAVGYGLLVKELHFEELKTYSFFIQFIIGLIACLLLVAAIILALGIIVAIGIWCT